MRSDNLKPLHTSVRILPGSIECMISGMFMRSKYPSVGSPYMVQALEAADDYARQQNMQLDGQND